ncbi:MAG: hemolysin III family protein [Gammaproteobacteria bacterium]|jgi:hemolysin III|nr:hemolysin III family protein [Gammaproteobacteria bacterium]
MNSSYKHTTYPLAEERINIASHGLGFLLSIAAIILLTIKAADALAIVSVSVFAVSLIALYGASTIYHSTSNVARRAWLRTVDHAMIYVLIAGTYTPFCLLILKGTVGWTIFGVTWGMAAAGITLKLFYTGHYDKLSTAMYVFMGWMIVFAIKPLIANFPPEGLSWLFAGGISYTVGALAYSFKKLPYGHAIFHIFCLVGSACHFVSVYFFVLAPIN